MPRTEAGKRLHDARHFPEYCSDPCELREEIDAIEADARAAVLRELREGVEGIAGKPSGEIITGTCYMHQQWGCATCRPQQWLPDGDESISRAAVLAAIDRRLSDDE